MSISRIYQNAMNAVADFGPQEWLFSLLAALLMGVVCMRGFGSRSTY